METGRRIIVGEARDRTLFWTLVFKGNTDPNATIDTPCFLTRIQILRICLTEHMQKHQENVAVLGEAVLMYTYNV